MANPRKELKAGKYLYLASGLIGTPSSSKIRAGCQMRAARKLERITPRRGSQRLPEVWRLDLLDIEGEPIEWWEFNEFAEVVVPS